MFDRHKEMETVQKVNVILPLSELLTLTSLLSPALLASHLRLAQRSGVATNLEHSFPADRGRLKSRSVLTPMSQGLVLCRCSGWTFVSVGLGSLGCLHMKSELRPQHLGLIIQRTFTCALHQVKHSEIKCVPVCRIGARCRWCTGVQWCAADAHSWRSKLIEKCLFFFCNMFCFLFTMWFAVSCCSVREVPLFGLH